MVEVQGARVQTATAARLLRLAALCAALVLAIGLLVIGGWYGNIAVLKNLNPGWVNMRFNTALGFVLLGAGLWALVRGERGMSAAQSLAIVAGLLALVLGAVTTTEYLWHWNSGLDLLFFAEPPGELGISSPGRMAPLTAVSFALGGLLLFTPRLRRLRQAGSLVVAAISLQVLIGYVFGTAFLYELPQHVGMAVHTAAGFLLFALGLFCTLPDAPLVRLLTGNKAGSIMARRMLPTVFLLPIVTSVLRVKGEKAGLYAPGFGISLAVVFNISVQTLMIFWALDTLNRKEQSEAEKRRLLTAVLDSLGEGVVAMDTSLHMNIYNRTAREMLGVGRSDDGPENWTEHYGVFQEDGKTRLEPANYPLMIAIKGESSTDTIQFIRNEQRPDGLYINVSAYPMHDEAGNIHGAVSVFTDITEKRRARRQLDDIAHYAEAHSAALTLFNQGHDRARLLRDFMALLDRSLGFSTAVFYSYDDWRGCFDLEQDHGGIGHLRVELPREEEWLQVCLTAAAAPGPVPLARLLLEGADVPAMELLPLPVRNQDSTLGLLLLGPAPAEVLVSGFLHRLGIQLGAALHNLRQYESTRMLATQLRLRNEEVARKNEELESASKLKSEFLASMSHELRTPLNAIIGFSEILFEGMLGELTPKQRECVKDVYDSGQYLLDLINDILDLSKIEAGRMTLEREAQDVVALLGNALTVVRERALSKGLDLAVRLPGAPVLLEVDGRRIKQIVYNLLSNAVKFTPGGGQVQLGLRYLSSAALQTLAVDYRSGLPAPDAEYMGIEVIDSGIGIGHEDMAKLFQPFVQIDSSLSRQYSGSGLGLIIVRRLTELHGGLVTVNSAPGKGSRFSVWLPLGDPVQPPPVVVEDNGRPLALIIEDDRGHADMIRIMLEAEGFQCIHAATGAHALELATTHPCQLITLDLVLPDMDGCEILLQLKSVPQLRQTPVVIISIIADENAKRGVSLGASGVLSKPLDREDLMQVLMDIGLRQQGKPQHRVLIIDDDPLAIDILQTFLREIPGIEVITACSGEEGIALTNELLPDLLVVDLLMPEVNGFEVVQALQKNPAAMSIPVIVVTAKQLSDEERKQLWGRVRLVIEKAQFTRHSFLNEVRRAIRPRLAVPVEQSS